MSKNNSKKFRNEIVEKCNQDFRQFNLSKSKSHSQDPERDRLIKAAISEFLAAKGISVGKTLDEERSAIKTLQKKSSAKFKDRKVKKLPDDYTSKLISWPKKSTLSQTSSFGGVLAPTSVPDDGEAPPTPELQFLPPDNSEDFNVSVNDYGSGYFGIEAEAEGGNEYRVILLEYTFVPDQTATWTFFTSVDFHGYYILYADDSWWNSRRASVNLQASISVSQYFVAGQNSQTLINISSQNINESSLYDNLLLLSTSVPLRSGDTATVNIAITLKAYARGDNSYAELNFSNGDGNFIRPLDTVAIVTP